MKILITLLGLALGARALGRKASARVLIVLAVVFFWAAGSGPLTDLMISHVQVNERLTKPEWGRRNVIVVLGWDTETWPGLPGTTGILGGTRVSEAARLYRACAAPGRACRVLASGGDPFGRGEAEGDVMARDLVGLGVPESDLMRESKSLNTFQNAQFSTQLLEPYDPDVILVVTSGYHVKRSLMYFAHFLNRAVVGVAADHITVRWGWLPRALNLFWFDTAAIEWLGLKRYPVYNWLGWNPPARSAGPDGRPKSRN